MREEYRLANVRVDGGMSRLRLKIGAFFFDLGFGIMEGYPACCSAHFAYDTFRGKRVQAIERGLVRRPYPDGSPNQYVPCLLHKGRKNG